jgi:hypothetical protein
MSLFFGTGITVNKHSHDDDDDDDQSSQNSESLYCFRKEESSGNSRSNVHGLRGKRMGLIVVLRMSSHAGEGSRVAVACGLAHTQAFCPKAEPEKVVQLHLACPDFLLA